MPDRDERGRQFAAAFESARELVQASGVEWTRLLQDLIRIPSCFEAEHAIVQRICDEVSALGLAPVLVPMNAAALAAHPNAMQPISNVAGRNNVVVRLPGEGGGRSLILNCHLDVQPAGDPAEWTSSPFSGHIDPANKAIYGRGAMDDKAGVAICLALMRVIVEKRLRFDGDLIFQFVLEDEITGNGSLMCLEAGHVADAAFIIDGTRPDRAIDQHAGNLEFHIKLKGRPASVSVSHLGVNAAELMARLLVHVRDAFFRLNDARQPPWAEFPSPYQFVIHALQVDAPRFTVPVDAIARCFVTFVPPDTLASTREFLERECRDFAKEMNLDGVPELLWDGFAAEPVSCATDELRTLLRSILERAGIPHMRIGPSTGTSDMRHFGEKSIPCLLYGPGRGFNPHRADEYYYLEDLPFMIKVYLDIVAEWCSRRSR